MSFKKIYCCGCQHEVDARLTDGSEVYSHRADLKDLPFWICDGCNNFVGCHHKTKQRTKPLGVIPTPEIKKARQEIHKILDPIWQSGKMPRGKVYHEIAGAIGVQNYHTAEIRTIEQARKVYIAIKQIIRDLKNDK